MRESDTARVAPSRQASSDTNSRSNFVVSVTCCVYSIVPEVTSVRIKTLPLPSVPMVNGVGLGSMRPLAVGIRRTKTQSEGYAKACAQSEASGELVDPVSAAYFVAQRQGKS